eukprot:CAMPEP_0119491654 /NCGR_PEP_ID=MMETSP1344-20130328/16457_1 /TAXON_ID=236787 /ORGANISM="Florenciella parvula, Strain CCMP2471" /LENGTH=272 /DNA_ID=CAMNT_0007526915 /DNA_START=159 /DNA_END=974 /DNA_ORIENTATION=+
MALGMAKKEDEYISKEAAQDEVIRKFEALLAELREAEGLPPFTSARQSTPSAASAAAHGSQRACASKDDRAGSRADAPKSSSTAKKEDEYISEEDEYKERIMKSHSLSLAKSTAPLFAEVAFLDAKWSGTRANTGSGTAPEVVKSFHDKEAEVKQVALAERIAAMVALAERIAATEADDEEDEAEKAALQAELWRKRRSVAAAAAVAAEQRAAAEAEVAAAAEELAKKVAELTLADAEDADDGAADEKIALLKANNEQLGAMVTDLTNRLKE